MKTQLLLFALLVMMVWACSKTYDVPPIVSNTEWKSKKIDPYPQLLAGDPDSGFYYLINGTYLGTGLPYDMIKRRVERNKERFIRKSGLASEYGFAVFETEQGIDVMNGTCFSCHAGAVNGEVVLGLGNSLNDNQANLTIPAKIMNWRVRSKYKKDTATIASFDEFGKYFRLMAPSIHTNNPGVNPAARIAEACMQYRNPEDLSYNPDPQYEIRGYNLASDIPALWHMQKKNALYYTAVGRGDFTKLLFQASVLGIKDSTAARVAQEKFVHIAAWIRSLEPPKYPEKIDTVLAMEGKAIFLRKCKGCHGTYDAPETYPNKVISVDKIGTDPLYASYAADSKIVDWYNKSWFATSSPPSWFEPEEGYIAPPLDGLWATAPYLHNGSVPTVYEVLNSQARPDKWKRSKNSKDYDWRKLGWEYKEKNLSVGRRVYDTSLPGYNNQGHTYGDHLTEDDRWAVIEYLKTL
ncbi:MAG: hypothetical protein AAF573_08670 [Bacteroidota bacterium]